MMRLRRPPWWAMLLAAAGMALFVYLGVWQLHRAAYKESLLRRYAASVSAPPQDFSTVATRPPPDMFPRVRVRGHYLLDRIYLLDNPNHDRRGGVEVFVPFAADGETALLLVDAGFLPAGADGAAPVLPPLPATTTTLQGLYVPPPPVGFELGGDALARQTRWPKKSIFLDPAKLAGDLGRPLLPRVLALDAEPASGYVRRHALDLSMTPSRHRAYAFQWFSFALAALVMLLVLNRTKRHKTPLKTPDHE